MQQQQNHTNVKYHTGFDASSKIKVIKEIRAITGLGLKEAKEMVEGVPKVVKKDCSCLYSLGDQNVDQVRYALVHLILL